MLNADYLDLLSAMDVDSDPESFDKFEDDEEGQPETETRPLFLGSMRHNL